MKSTKEPRGLGKGLSALLGEVPTADQLRKPVTYVNKQISTPTSRVDGSEVLRVPVDQIDPNPYQPRLTFEQVALDELCTSIKTLGLIQPISVRRMPNGRCQIISGERRYRACCMAGMTTVPAYVREANDQGMMEMAIVENVQREGLDPIELALGYQRLMEECSFTQEQMAERVAKNRATIANTIRLLKLPAKVQHDLKVGLISQGHAKAILGIEDPKDQERLCDIVVSDGLSVRQLETLVRKLQISSSALKKDRKPAAVPELNESYTKLASNLGRFFSEEVSLKRSKSGKGTMTVHFSSDAEVEAFLQALESVDRQ